MKAKRGDLAAIVTEHNDTEIRDGHRVRVRNTRAELFTITNITRDGHVKAVRSVRYSDDGDATAVPLDRFVGLVSVALIPATSIDIPAAIDAAREHRWPGGGPYSGFRPFDSLDDLRDALRPCLRRPAEASI